MKKIDSSKTYQRIGIAVAAAILMSACASTPPVAAPTEQMALSRSAISSASSAGGSEYAPAASAARAGKAQKAADALRQSDQILKKELNRNAVNPQ